MRLSIGVNVRKSALIASAAMVALGAFPIRAEQPPSEKAEQQKRLHTIPEDDMIKPNSFIPPKPIRDLIASREGEDLIICIAGCRPGTDKVVYAQPTTKISLKEREEVLEQRLLADEDDEVPVTNNQAQDPGSANDSAEAGEGEARGTNKMAAPEMKPSFVPASAKNAAEPESPNAAKPSDDSTTEFEINVDAGN